MRKIARRSAVRSACAAAALALSPVTAMAQAEPGRSEAQAFPALPLPPAIEGPIGIPRTDTPPRSTYLALITREAEQRGLPAVDVEAVLSTLPLPPDTAPPTFASAALPEEVFAAHSSRKKLALGKPVADGHLQSGFGM